MPLLRDMPKPLTSEATLRGRYDWIQVEGHTGQTQSTRNVDGREHELQPFRGRSVVRGTAPNSQDVGKHIRIHSRTQFQS